MSRTMSRTLPMTTPVTQPQQLLLPGQHAAPAGPVDVAAMYVMPHAFRRDLMGFRAATANAQVGDRRRWAALHQRWELFATILHHHHTAEDNGLWPLLLERAAAAGDADARVVLDAMQAEHAASTRC